MCYVNYENITAGVVALGYRRGSCGCVKFTRNVCLLYVTQSERRVCVVAFLGTRWKCETEAQRRLPIPSVMATAACYSSLFAQYA